MALNRNGTCLSLVFSLVLLTRSLCNGPVCRPLSSFMFDGDNAMARCEIAAMVFAEDGNKVVCVPLEDTWRK